jgi:hypothetical protein
MLSDEQIAQWKSMYEEVYLVTILEQQFVFRVIGREEYKEILLSVENISDMQEAICQKAVLYPQAYDFVDNVAGIAETISNFILEASGLQEGQAKALLEQYRQDMTIFDYQADVIIHEAFPNISMEEIQSWSVKKMMYYLARAEWVLVNLRGVQLVPIEQETSANHQPGSGAQPQQHTVSPPPVQETNSVSPKNQQLSKEEVERMLSQAEGRPVNLDQPNTMNDIFPELAWFRAEEELKGDFE